jgi:hypothetical protein
MRRATHQPHKHTCICDLSSSAAVCWGRFANASTKQTHCKQWLTSIVAFAAVQGDRVQLRRVAVDLGWRMVAGWLRQLVAGKAPEQVLQWAPPPGEPEPLEKVQIRRSPSEVAAAAAPRSPLAVLPTKPKGVPQAETTSSSSSQGLTYKEVAATVEAAAEQWRLANEQLTQMLGALDVTDGALTGNSTAGGSESQAAADPAESSSHTQHHLELLGERQTPQLTEQQ